LGDVGEYGVGAAEGDQGGPGEEHSLGGEHAARTCGDGEHGEWDTPQHQADSEDLDQAAPARGFVVQSVVGDQRLGAVTVVAVAASTVDEVGCESG
jgi:hypothetical protein